MLARFNTEDPDNFSRNESNYNLTPLVTTTCKSQKGNKNNVCLDAFCNNKDFGLNGMNCNYNQVIAKTKSDHNYLMPIC